MAPRKSLQSAAPAAAPRTIFEGDEWSIEELDVGMQVLAEGFAPAGGREWYRATITAFRTSWPPITVRFTATADGDTQPLLLPQPATAYVHRGQIRLE